MLIDISHIGILPFHTHLKTVLFCCFVLFCWVLSVFSPLPERTGAGNAEPKSLNREYILSICVNK